jgi:hypothetical protein
MKFYQLAQKVLEVYPAILLDKIISHEVIKKLRTGFLTVIAVGFVLNLFNIFPAYTTNIRGLLFISFSLWITFYLLDAMFYSFYFSKKSALDFEVAKIVEDTKEDDITKSFLKSDIGKFALLRLGISEKETE